MTKRIIISGFVQGIGFRRRVLRISRQLHLSGWVKNREDGSVEALLSGEPDAVTQAISDFGISPLGGRVDRIDQYEADPPDEPDFRVL